MNQLSLPLSISLTLLVTALASTGATARGVPTRSIPPSVLMDVRVVENEFRAALANDCAPERCFLKGCVYESHITLDQPRSASLPGLPADEGPGSVEPQEFLTRARCEFTHEKTVSQADVAKLASRLEKRLSHGWLTVSVDPQALEPIPKSLAEPEPEEEEADDADEIAEPVVPPPPPELTTKLAMGQLWEELLPHSPWMLAIFLLTLALLVIIWASRRLGAPSLEERLMESQLLQNAGTASGDAAGDANEAEAAVRDAGEDAFAAEQESLWNERLDRVAPEDGDVIARLLREWLKRGDYPMLARALLVFGDRVSKAFDAAPELALKKVDFAAYFRDVDEASLPSRAKFFRELNQQSMASLLLSQDDVRLYRSLREDFGASGFVSLMRDVPARYAALLFALADYEQQNEIAGMLSSELRSSVAAELLHSNRISLRESAYLAACVEAVREGQPLPHAPTATTHREHGPSLDSATALSALLPYLAGAERAALFHQEGSQSNGSVPHWYEDIVFGHMLTALDPEVRDDLLLEVDIRGLSAWLRMQQPAWRKAFIVELSAPLQNAIANSQAATSRTEQIRWAKRGHDELGTALKGAYSQRGVRFVDLVA